jgi:hypothetical protein
MFGEKKRLFLLIGLLVAAGCTYVVVHGVPWSASEDEIDLDLGDLGDAGTVAAAKPDGTPESGGNSSGTGGARHAVGNARRPSQAAGPSPRAKLYRKKVARIAERPKPEYLPQLRQAAKSGDEDTRETALVGMGRLGDSADTALLIHALRTDESPAVRVAAATALGHLRCWDAGPALMDALDDSDARVRSRAGAALEKIIGLRLGFRANDPDRAKVIRRIRTLWPGFYQYHLRHQAGRG